MTLSPSSTSQFKRLIDIVSVILLGSLQLACPIWILDHQELVRSNVGLFMELAFTAVTLCTFSDAWLTLPNLEFPGRMDMHDRCLILVPVLAPPITLLAYSITVLNT
jgi:hypothetical protein